MPFHQAFSWCRRFSKTKAARARRLRKEHRKPMQLPVRGTSMSLEADLKSQACIGTNKSRQLVSCDHWLWPLQFKAEGGLRYFTALYEYYYYELWPLALAFGRGQLVFLGQHPYIHMQQLLLIFSLFTVDLPWDLKHPRPFCLIHSPFGERGSSVLQTLFEAYAYKLPFSRGKILHRSMWSPKSAAFSRHSF